jgi:hypothetical protein
VLTVPDDFDFPHLLLDDPIGDRFPTSGLVLRPGDQVLASLVTPLVQVTPELCFTLLGGMRAALIGAQGIFLLKRHWSLVVGRLPSAGVFYSFDHIPHLWLDKERVRRVPALHRHYGGDITLELGRLSHDFGAYCYVLCFHKPA